MTLEILNPIAYPDWNELLIKDNEGCFFHSREWALTLHEAFGFEPCYFSQLNNQSFDLLIPIMEVNSILTGRRGVSLPFTDYCPWISKNDSQHILEKIFDHARKRKWKYIEFRDNNNFLNKEPHFCSYYEHTIDISQGEEELFRRLKETVRRNIKKALREGVKVHFGTTLDDLKKFYHLYCITRKRHGLPPQSFKFFKTLHKHIISREKGIISLATYKNTPIAGIVFFHFGKKVIYKYAASDRRYQHLRGNNLTLWEGIRYYSHKGFKLLSLGRTELKNYGLRQFKLGWSTIEREVKYYRYDPTRSVYITGNRESIPGYEIIKRLPVPLLRFLGTLSYRHVA